MSNETLAHSAEHNVDHDRRDVSSLLIAILGAALALVCALLLVLLWQVHRVILPEATGGAVSVPVRMPGEPTVDARLAAIRQPRLDPLQPLQAQPPSFRSSQPVKGRESIELHPEDLRADRQPLLQRYGWVDRKNGIVHIPIDRAMDAILESGQLGPAPKKEGGK